MAASSRLTLLGVATLLFAPAQAWKVVTWEGQQCTSKELSSQDLGNGAVESACYSIPENAGSATVVKEDEDTADYSPW